MNAFTSALTRLRARTCARLGRGHRNEEGAALLEFSVVFPAQLFVTLSIMQIALIGIAHVMVQHAAFAAARAALVMDVPNTADSLSPQQRVQKAAAIVLAPICANDADLSQGPSPVTDGSSGDAQIQWPTSSGNIPTLAQRGAGGYAPITTVTIDPPGVANTDLYVSVQVTHEFALVIPVVNAFFAHAGPYLLYGADTGGKIHGYGVYPTLPITELGFVPRPWRKQ